MSGLLEPPRTVEAKIATALERLGQVQRSLLQQAATAHGLSPVQARLLDRLARPPQALHRPAALAAEFGVTRATVTDALAALARKQLISRAVAPRDRRQVHLEITAAGRALAHDLTGWDAHLKRQLAALPTDDQNALLSTLLGLIAGLQSAGVISTSRMCVTCRFFRPDAHPATPAPHHCALLDMALAERELRIDCPDHEQSA